MFEIWLKNPTGLVATMGGGGPMVRGICLLLSDRKALVLGDL